MDDTLLDVLRVHPEPAALFTELEVHAALTADPDGYLAFLQSCLTLSARGSLPLEAPPKRIFTDARGHGDFRVMPCVAHFPAEPFKSVKIVGTNVVGRRVPDQITVGRAFVLDPDENYVTHTFEACLLSSARTGACASLAVEGLAPRATSAVVVGAGRVGYYAALYLSRRPGLERLTVVDRDAGRAQRLADALAERATARCRTAGFEAVADAEVVVLATTSPEVVLAPGETGAGLVVSCGADAAGQRELDAAWAGANIHLDTEDSFAVGDLAAWREEGIEVEPATRYLTELFAPARNGRAGARAAFVSTGWSVLDNLTMAYLLRRSDVAR